MDFSIVLASRGRPKLLSNLLASIRSTAADISNVEVLIGIDNDDVQYRELSKHLHHAYPFAKFYSRERSNFLNRDYLNWLACEHSNSKYVIIGNDDTEFKTPHWDDRIRARMEQYLQDKPDRIAYGYLSDALINRHGLSYCCFPLVTREGIKALTIAITPEHPAWNADVALWRIYHTLGRVCDISEVMIEHISYHAGTRGEDEINTRVRNISYDGGVPFDEYIGRARRCMKQDRVLSILMPAIRVDRWVNFIKSIDVHHEWEVVMVTPPCTLPDEIKNCDRLIHIIDKGSPIRASCIAASSAQGKYITWAADDGTFLSGVLDKAVGILQSSPNEKTVVATKYLEACAVAHPDHYYRLNNAYPKSPYIPDHWWIFNCAFMHKSYYESIGGWDCQFETCALAHADLAARAQRDGAEVKMIQDALLCCTHMPGTSGDHAPVYDGHVNHDEPLYAQIYNNPDCVNRIRVDLNNWQNSPPVWRRRF